MNLLLDLNTWLLVILASIVGSVLTLTYYYLGQQGIEAVLARFPQIEEERWERVQQSYRQHGVGLLFFSFIPMLGLLLETAAGAAGIGVFPFLVWVLLGRLVRNWSVLLLLDQTLWVLQRLNA